MSPYDVFLAPCARPHHHNVLTLPACVLSSTTASPYDVLAPGARHHQHNVLTLPAFLADQHARGRTVGLIIDLTNHGGVVQVDSLKTCVESAPGFSA